MASITHYENNDFFRESPCIYIFAIMYLQSVNRKSAF